MGAFLDKPNTEKKNDHGSGNGLKFAVSSMQGWRIDMEDSHCSVLGLPYALKDWSFFSVFDGHAGSKVSIYSSENLLDAITSNENFRGGTSKPAASISPTVENVKEGIRQGFLQLDDKMRNLPEMLNGTEKSGTTVCSCLISPTHIYFANCGDSRAILCREGRVFYSTQDHKPVNPKEMERIYNAGGSVMIQRVNGSLAVSRALGDFEYKNVDGKGQCEQLVSPEPETAVIERAPDKDEFIVLACDGIWDELSNEELCTFINSRLEITDNLETICNDAVDTSLYKGSRDNMSIVIVTFRAAPTVKKEMIDLDAELDRRLEAKVKELVDTHEPGEVDMNFLMHSLLNFEGLPPGGGIFSKRNVLYNILKRVSPYSSTNEDEDLLSEWRTSVQLKTAQKSQASANGPGDDGTDTGVEPHSYFQ